MRFGLILSVIVHVSILLAAVIVLPKTDELVPKVQESIPVEIVDFTGKTQQVATKKDSKPLPEKEKPLPPKVEKVEKPKPTPEPAPEVKKAEVEPAPEPEPVKEPEPDPLKELIKKAEKLPEPEPEPAPVEKQPEPEKAEAETSPLPVPRVKPKVPKKFAEAQKKKKKKKRKLDLNKLSALLNKIDEKPKQRPPDVDETGTPATGEIDNLLGKDLKLTGSEADYLRQKVQACWSPPTAVSGAETLMVRVRFKLDAFGSVVGAPRVLNPSSRPGFDVAAQAAVRAVLGCQPYDGLPPEKFVNWENNIINFDPSIMLRVN